jgi:hypothetical protein
MNRKEFFKNTILGAMALPSLASKTWSQPGLTTSLHQDPNVQPLAITMWDFSWIERRWPGAGYENWDKALRELSERGYNAVRIDAFPHLLAKNPEKEWILKPVWSVHEWGSPSLNKIQIQPALNNFIAACSNYKIKVGLSSWYREDADNSRMEITSPEKMAEQWLVTLESIQREGLLDTIFYLDLCNEWPGDFWAPYFTNDPPELTWGGWYTKKSLLWMKKAVSIVKEAYPGLPAGISIEPKNPNDVSKYDVSFMDYLDPHIWMVQQNGNEFYNKLNYKEDVFSNSGYETLVANAEHLYNSNKSYWQQLLKDQINKFAEIAEKLNYPLLTTECWAIVGYKDWPLLSWDWVKELCEIGTMVASDSGQWVAIATSNFCGPQFSGMWEDIEWHQRLTQYIRAGKINKNLQGSKIVKRVGDEFK